ncbi:MAG: hypothetical protein Q4A63_06180, partial [Butyricicoccus pullicaecorum]|nr:hypothetical protein [Butyricicoccus pullicaecorum]
MKIFGGKTSKGSKSAKKKQKTVFTPYDGDPNYDVMAGAAEPKKGKSAKKKSHKKNIILLVFAIIAFILAGGAFLAVQFIKPPDISIHENDKTIIDEENGDVVAIDPGQRISDYFTFLVCATD